MTHIFKNTRDQMVKETLASDLHKVNQCKVRFETDTI
jgi:hypothetical protein